MSLQMRDGHEGVWENESEVNSFAKDIFIHPTNVDSANVMGRVLFLSTSRFVLPRRKSANLPNLID